MDELRINQTDLNTRRMTDLMAITDNAPLYMETVKRILKVLREDQQDTGKPFNYGEFKKMLSMANLTIAQWTPLNQRLDTLESFMVKAQLGPQSAGGAQKLSGKGIDWTPKV